jgi:hypothetical protein
MCGCSSSVEGAGFNNAIGDWFKSKIIDPITTAKNDAIQDVKQAVDVKIMDPITTAKNDVLGRTTGFVKNIFTGATDQSVPSFDTPIIESQPTAPNIGKIIAYSLGGVAILALTIAVIVKLKKGKAAA